MKTISRIAILAVALCAIGTAALRADQSPPPPQAAQEQAAGKLLQASDWPNAAVAYQALAAKEAENPRAWFGLGVALHETGKYADAIDAFLKAEARQYINANQIRFRLARADAKLGRADQALAELERLAASGFTNATLLQSADLSSVATDARFAAVTAQINRNAKPCESDPLFRKFDFWIGDWDVQPTGAPRAPVGAGSKVEKILDGCVIFENWTPPGGRAGKSFNSYNTAKKQWEQYWVDAGGQITFYVGNFRDDGNLYYEADQFGSSNRIRMTFFNQGADQVRQLGHLSTDGGKTWTVSFDLTYVRKKPI